MTRATLPWALCLLAACGGIQNRPEPPSGAVDPGVHGLAMPGQPAPGSGGAAPDAATAGMPSVPGLSGLPGLPGLPGAPPAAPPPARAPDAEHPQETAGAITMTREHCATLGRKFAELTLAQGGAASLDGTADRATQEREAAGVAQTFADRCGREMVGQTVDMREYQCMLRARAADELLGCKR